LGLKSSNSFLKKRSRKRVDEVIGLPRKKRRQVCNVIGQLSLSLSL
jgi:hypothetical protein